jgi:hypothetical protein
MIVHQPETLRDGEYIITWAEIELDDKVDNFPEYLWFRVPSHYADCLSLQSDAFLIPSLQAAMHFGEDIRVRGPVSPRLAYHLDEYQFIQSLKFPKELRRVNVSYERLAPLQVNPRAVGVSFSGGIDSFYALYKHLPQNQPLPGYQITHALFINGFDITQKDRDKYQNLLLQYLRLLAKLDIELLPLETNLVSSVIPWLEYRRFYAPVLLGSVLALGGLFKRFILSNSRHYTQVQVNSNPLADRLLSTETLDLEHFGATILREDKLEAISEWQMAQQALRVCGAPNLEALNCCKCEKCVRSMLPIYALGRMPQFRTFPDPLKSNRDVLRLARKFDPYSDHMPTNYAFFKRHKPGLLPWLRVAALLGASRFWLLRLLPGSIKGWLGRYGYFVDTLRQPFMFDNPRIIQAIQTQGHQNVQEGTK